MNLNKKRYLQINYKALVLDLEVLKYKNGRIAIQAYTKTKEPLDVVTVNIPAYDKDYGFEYIFLNVNHYPYIKEAMVNAGLVEDTGYKVWSGYCVYPVVRWLR